MVKRRHSLTATVLFTDLVGSTELMGRLGDAGFDQVRDEHFTHLGGVVSAHNGDQVKNTGDGILAVFASAVDALAAAVAAQQAAEAQSRMAGVPVSIRVGLAIGEVALTEDDVFGTPVVEAARLVERAKPSQILCSALVRTMAGSRAAVSFADLGTLDLKGLPAPLPTCEVAWEPLVEVAPPVPLPSLLETRGRIFVGRNEEFARLRQRWKEACAGDRRLVFLGGEPGIGKTRLAVQLAHGLHAEGALVLAGRCDEDLAVAYQPVVEALRHYVAQAAEPRLGRYAGELARLAPEVAQLVPGLAEPMHSDPETERYRLFDAVAAWLSEASTSSPLLLVLDDVHWAAKPTLLLIRHLMRSPEPMRLLVLATYRDSDIGRGHPLAELLADVPRLEAAERVVLGGLDLSAVTAFLEAAAGHELEEPVAQAVWRETEGNPFFLSEVVRNLVESGTLVERDGRWSLAEGVEDLGIPEGVRDVVGRRLSRLSGETNLVLACASVVGLEFEPAVVQVAGAFPEDTVLGALEEAAAARLVVEAPGLLPRSRFSHALVRATLYDEISMARQVSLHRRVAEAIESVHGQRIDDYLPALAHHWARAAAPSPETARAVEYAKRAGDQALALLAHDEALAYYRQGLEILDVGGAPPDDGRRLELMIALGEAQQRSGDDVYRETLLAAAHLAGQRGDALLLARAALANSRGFYASAAGQIDRERVATLRAALDAIGHGEASVRARLLAALGHELAWAGDREERARLSDESLAIARRLDDPAALADVLLKRCFILSGPDLLAERQTSAAELLAVATSLGDPATRCRALFLRFRGCAEAGEMEEADRFLEQAEHLATELGQPTLRWMVGLSRTGRVLLGGKIDEAEQLVYRHLELGLAIGQPDAPVLFAGLLLAVRFEQGRLEEIEDQLASGAAANPGLPAFQAGLALVRTETGRSEEAREPYERLAADFRALPLDNAWTVGIAACAVACARLEDRPRAAVLSDLLKPYAHQFVFTAAGSWGPISYYLGVLATTLGHYDEADARFGAAAGTCQRIGAPSWLARTRLEWAAMLLRRDGPGDGEQARELLNRALGTATDLGLHGVERRARTLLEAPV